MPRRALKYAGVKDAPLSGWLSFLRSQPASALAWSCGACDMTKEHVEMIAMAVCVALVGLWAADTLYHMMTRHIAETLGVMK